MGTQMAEVAEGKGLKTTLNLPQTSFPMKANLPQNEPARLAGWAELGRSGQDGRLKTGTGLYAAIRAARAGCGQVHPARRAAVRQRSDPPGPCAEQVHQGLHGQDEDHGGLRRAAMCRAGTATGCRSRSRWTRSWGARSWRWPGAAVRRACREYAQKYIDLQRSQFERHGRLRALGRSVSDDVASGTRRRSSRPFTSFLKRASSTRD